MSPCSVARAPLVVGLAGALVGCCLVAASPPTASVVLVSIVRSGCLALPTVLLGSVVLLLAMVAGAAVVGWLLRLVLSPLGRLSWLLGPRVSMVLCCPPLVLLLAMVVGVAAPLLLLLLVLLSASSPAA